MPALTTTSYAILGLLNLRPHTAYELAAQSQRSLRFAWPTAQSRLYAEPKRLEAEGLITVSEQSAGPTRTRQQFRITPAGRRALRAWLRTEPAAPRIEAEVLLRTLLADAGTDDDLIDALRRTREAVDAEYAEGREIVDAYIDGEVGYPERLHLNVLWMVFVREFHQLVHDWTLFAEDEVNAWGNNERGATDRAVEILQTIATDRRAFLRRPI